MTIIIILTVVNICLAALAAYQQNYGLAVLFGLNAVWAIMTLTAMLIKEAIKSIQ